MPSPEFDQKYPNTVFWAALGAVVVAAGIVLWPFVPAILWAIVLSILTHKFYARGIRALESRVLRRLHPEKRSGIAQSASAFLTVIATLLIIVLPLSIVGLMMYVQIQEFVQSLQASQPGGADTLSLQEILARVDEAIRPLAERFGQDFNASGWFEQNKQDIIRSVSGPLGKAAVGMGVTLLTFVIALLTMFFTLRDAHRLREPALDLIPLPREQSERILKKLCDTVYGVFIGVVLVALVQGSIAGITYWATGVPHPVVWFVATTVLAALPLMGAPVVYVPWGLILIAQGKTVEGVVLLAVGFLIVSQVDNILRPFVIGAHTDLHPMAIFFSLLGGILALGPVGLMAGPMLLTVLLSLIEVARERRKLSRESLGIISIQPGDTS